MENKNYPKVIQKLIDLFCKFPGVGPKTAARFVFYLIKQGDQDVKDLAQSISVLKESLKVCSFCFKLFQPDDLENNGNLCAICSNGLRNKSALCVVEKQTDLVSIEKNNIYKGLYFILGGTVSNLSEKSISKLRISELEQRIKNPKQFGILNVNIQEIILAINPTVDGEATTLYLERKLKNLDKKITRLGRGLSTGAELEYADQETMRSAFQGRK
ncbi:MAG: recombination protein RecR [Candidatus Pacebacteria bacterium]|nr:recombination protein RecR [Candidatus Paceibacterota bacterium]